MAWVWTLCKQPPAAVFVVVCVGRRCRINQPTNQPLPANHPPATPSLAAVIDWWRVAIDNRKSHKKTKNKKHTTVERGIAVDIHMRRKQKCTNNMDNERQHVAIFVTIKTSVLAKWGNGTTTHPTTREP